MLKKPFFCLNTICCISDFPQLHYVVFMSTFQPKQGELSIVNGTPLPEMPEDLYIPPQALEICLETFTGPMD